MGQLRVRAMAKNDYATTGPDPGDDSQNSQRLNTDPATDLDASTRFTCLVPCKAAVTVVIIGFLLRVLFFVGSAAVTDTSPALFGYSFVFLP